MIEVSVEDILALVPDGGAAAKGLIEAIAKVEGAESEILAMQQAFADRRVTQAMGEIARRSGGAHLLNSMRLAGEASLMSMVAFFMQRGEFKVDGIPYTEHDKVAFEMVLQRCRADAVIFHVDGTITAIEAKDGSHGYRSVVAGIGQVGYYATLLGSQNTGMKVRRALLWSKTGSKDEDESIKKACELSGVVPALFERPAEYHARLRSGISDAVRREVREREAAVYAALDDDEKGLLKKFGLLPEGL